MPTLRALALALLIAVPATAAIPQSERDALISLYDSTGGASWTDHTGWRGAAGTECQWYGVTCNDAQTSVRQLYLNDNNLSGNLPSLTALTNLQLLVLFDNHLVGQIPPSLGSMANLEELYLDVNQFSGPIPRELGNLAKLRVLHLGANDLTGSIPPELGNLGALEEMFLPENELTGAIPSDLGRLQNLRMLDLQSNELTGAIPPQLGNLPRIVMLQFNANDLSGPLPVELYRATTLTDLYVGFNKITAIPPGINALTSLRLLYLPGNEIDGAFPADIARLPRIEEIDLYANRITGSFPPELFRIPTLRKIEVSTNRMSGPLPPLAGAPSLEEIGLSQNSFSGPLPSDIGTLTNLRSLYIYENQFSGALPESLRNCTQLSDLVAFSNKFEGTLPAFLGSIPSMRQLLLSNNLYNGPIPNEWAAFENLTYLDIGDNELTGSIPTWIDHSRGMQYLVLSGNLLGGTIPEQLWNLTDLVYLRIEDNDIGGPLSRRVGELTKLEVFNVGYNALTGTIPAEISRLTRVIGLSLGGNRFTGTIPREIGQMSWIGFMDLAYNDLHGPIPNELLNLSGLGDGSVAIGFNALWTDNQQLRDFLNRKDQSNDWEVNQTVAPTNVRVAETTDRSATLTWDLIRYTNDPGGYRIAASTTPGGAPVAIITTSSKDVDTATIRGLSANTTYFYTVSTITHPHDLQQNLVVSDRNATVQSTTTAPVVAPPDVDVTTPPDGLVQIDGVAQNEDSFVVTNFGDVATEITLETGDNFYTMTPTSFSLRGGASQTVRLTSRPMPNGVYYGGISIRGTGARDGLAVFPTLLSVARPVGTVVAEAVTARVEIIGEPGTESIGSARFRNIGTAPLTGVAVSEVPWIVPATNAITIFPNETGTLNFRIVRSRRPLGAEGGSLEGTLKLVYVDGSQQAIRGLVKDTPPSVGVSRVTVVDVARPPVTSGSIPPLPLNEIAYFAPGVANQSRTNGSLATDVSVANAFGTRAISDLRLYFTPVAGSSTSVAAVSSVQSAQAVSLVNVVGSVYGASSSAGTLQVRSRDWESLIFRGTLLSLRNSTGAFLGDLPVFRSDRALPPNQSLYLVGVRKDATMRGDLYVQELIGGVANVRVSFLNANGNTLGETRTVPVTAFAVAELLDAVPAGAATVVVTNDPASNGRVVAYVRMTDDASGDTWSVVDWTRYHRLVATDALRLPLVESGATAAPAGGGRRRAGPKAEEPAARTEIMLFNPGPEAARAKVAFVTPAGQQYDRDYTINAQQTVTIADLAPAVGAPSGRGQALVTPLRGQVMATSRTYRPLAAGGTYGTAVQIVGAPQGLRLGQSKVFAGLEDSTAATVAAARPATFRTNIGFVETAGERVKVRATILLSEGRSPVSTSVSREFDVAPGQMLFVADLLRAIVGTSRDTAFDDLHNLQLQLQVTEGAGAVLPFVTVVDNGTGDSVLRLE